VATARTSKISVSGAALQLHARSLAGALLCVLLAGCIGSQSSAPSYFLLTAPAR
jgi:hypothetical protein